MEAVTQEGALPDEEAEAPKSGFEINGKRYAIPTLNTINLDEERILYVYADTVLQDFVPVHPDAPEDEQAAAMMQQLRIVRNPDFKRALAHIAYRREHPGVSDADIQSAIGLVNALEVEIAMLRGEEDDPPSSSSQRSSSTESDESEPSSLSTSGSDTEPTSPSPVLTLASTGTTESDTSSPLSAQATPV